MSDQAPEEVPPGFLFARLAHHTEVALLPLAHLLPPNGCTASSTLPGGGKQAIGVGGVAVPWDATRQPRGE
jgi:hypothetical protein